MGHLGESVWYVWFGRPRFPPRDNQPELEETNTPKDSIVACTASRRGRVPEGYRDPGRVP
jgi:hypothetical protein